MANLPYIATTEVNECDPETKYEPEIALFSGHDGLDLIREAIPDMKRYIAFQQSYFIAFSTFMKLFSF